MVFLDKLLPPGSVAAGLATLSLAVTLGLFIGVIPFRGLKLGVAGVLFSALLFGQIGLTINDQVLNFLRDFSLIIFVYTIGLQVGPGFVDSLKSEGMRLNLLSIAVLVLGGAMTVAVVLATHVNHAGTSGLYAGAFTTTPGLAAGQEVLKHSLDGRAALDAVQFAGLAYAVTYPFGVFGPVLTIAFFRRVCKVDVAKEREAHLAATQVRRPPTTSLDIDVTQPAMDGMIVKDLSRLHGHNVIFSRILHDKIISVPTGQTRISVGDVLRANGARAVLDNLVSQMGRVSAIDLSTASGDITRMELLVTNTHVLRRPLRELDLMRRTGVALARVTRSGLDLIPTGNLTLHFGDSVTAVGPPSGLKAVEQELGNSTDALNRPQLIPIFLGIVLGVIVGSVPLALPGSKGGITLGLAAGPMLVAICLSRLGNVGSVVWYMPAAANQLFRDFGLAVFLGCVGLQQGDQFIQKLLTGNGIALVVWGALITMLPVIAVGLFARRVYKLNFLTLSGWVAGAMTSSPALMYAGDITQSDAPSLAYAAVAPLALIVPIICCQVLASIR